jgi:outer membrane protein OmpA-like peptidoglycan-associated protein
MMKSPRVALRVAALAILCSPLLSGALAQPILRGKDLTEKNLIEALTPPPREVRTRSIRVERDQALAQPGETASQEASRKAGASLLITFKTNSAQLTPQAQSSLDVVARALQADRLAAFNFAIEGHADPRGTPDHNLRLSQARAESVVAYLTSHHRIGGERLKPIGKGDTEPANPAQPEAPENRRVTITTLRQ